MTLSYNGQLRTETDQVVIDNLLRKGWVEIPDRPTPPTYDANTQKIVYDAATNFWSIIDLTSEEIAAKTALQQQIALGQQIADSVRAGYLVSPENFTLALGESDRNSFTQMLALVKEALDLGLIDNNANQIIADINGEKHTVSTLRFRQIIVGYGNYYKNLWNQI